MDLIILRECDNLVTNPFVILGSGMLSDHSAVRMHHTQTYPNKQI